MRWPAPTIARIFFGAFSKEAQQRLSALAQSDATWANIQGQIVAYNEMLGEMKEKTPDVAPKGK